MTNDEMANERDMVLSDLRREFPSLERYDLAAHPHQYWVELRETLALLVPEDVTDLLPFVLVDLIETIPQSAVESGDMVIIFLDVWHCCVDDPKDPKLAELIRRFAEEEIGGEAGEKFKRMMFTDITRLGREHMTDDEIRAEDYECREASFGQITIAQAKTIYRCLQFFRNIQEDFERRNAVLKPGNFCEPEPFERCKDDLNRAMAYWHWRSIGNRTLGRPSDRQSEN